KHQGEAEAGDYPFAVAVIGGDGLCGGAKARAVDQGEGEGVDAVVEGAGEQAEHNQASTPDRPARVGNANACGDGANAGQERDGAGEKHRVRGADERGWPLVRGELVGEEERDAEPQERAGQQQARPDDEGEATQPWTGEGKGPLVTTLSGVPP